MEEFNIKKLDELIQRYIDNGKIIHKKDISRLIKRGENYCSLLLKVDVTLKCLNEERQEILKLVAKCRNTDRNFFEILATWQFQKEIDFYTKIVPVFENFQRELGMEDQCKIFAKVYAARKNLHGKSEDIEDAVILMENLSAQGKLSNKYIFFSPSVVLNRLLDIGLS